MTEFTTPPEEDAALLDSLAIDSFVALLNHLQASNKGGKNRVHDVPFYAHSETAQAIVVDAPGSVVAKLSRHPAANAFFEALIVDSLAGGSPDKPFAVPSLISYDPALPDLTLLTKVEGAVLPNEKARAFTIPEQQAFGHNIGEFVCWLGATISQEAYARILDRTGFAGPSDRVNNIKRFAAKARAGEVKDPTLTQLLIEIEDEYMELRDGGLLTPSLVGHDDLRVDNMTFEEVDGQWRLNGVFDFGLTKPSSPERELRHVVALGKVVGEAAIAGYEKASGQTLSKQLLQFWAVGQAASACASFAEGQPINKLKLETRVNDLCYLLPDRDWSGLKALLAT